jgi:tRNA (guanine-N1)-methyltransferase
MYKGLSVPSILLSGNHGEIERYRFKKSLKWSLQNRKLEFFKYFSKFLNE